MTTSEPQLDQVMEYDYLNTNVKIEEPDNYYGDNYYIKEEPMVTDEQNIDQTDTKPSLEKFVCPVCGQYKKKLPDHMKKKHKKTCHLCHKQFKTEAETSLHVSQGYLY